ncbi:MAG: hypothetical protein KAT65_06040, partial [Methanophagales archaeon]|nr:hypothetical protein [Methanophagales archaeon]
MLRRLEWRELLYQKNRANTTRKLQSPNNFSIFITRQTIHRICEWLLLRSIPIAEKGYGIFLKKFDSNWNQLKKVQVTSESSLQDRPSITYADGYFYVAYFSKETGTYDIFVKRLNNNLNLASWKKQITSKSSYQSYPFITFLNNQFVISSASTESGTLGIYMKKYDSSWNYIEKTKIVDSSAKERRPSHTWDG